MRPDGLLLLNDYFYHAAPAAKTSARLAQALGRRIEVCSKGDICRLLGAAGFNLVHWEDRPDVRVSDQTRGCLQPVAGAADGRAWDAAFADNRQFITPYVAVARAHEGP